MKRLFMVVFLCNHSFASLVGNSVHPLKDGEKKIGAEFTGSFTDKGGVGILARYTHRFNQKLTADFGAGLAGGDRNGRVFIGADYEMFPDYQNQPRISLKTNFERSYEFDSYRHIISAAPVVSKGFSFWGQEAFPFISLPVGVSLNPKNDTYKTPIAGILGATSDIDLEDQKKLTLNFEFQVNLNESYTGFALGASYAI